MIRSHALSLGASLALCQLGAAQTAIFQQTGPNSDVARGQAVAGGADLDGDGFDDLIVSSPGADTSGKTDNGLVQAISGQTGTVLFQRAATAPPTSSAGASRSRETSTTTACATSS